MAIETSVPTGEGLLAECLRLRGTIADQTEELTTLRARVAEFERDQKRMAFLAKALRVTEEKFDWHLSWMWRGRLRSNPDTTPLQALREAIDAAMSTEEVEGS